ncbi:alpha amylase, all-beta domain protein [Dictyocaulus viviparus]|uniref:Alpha amylase, all-beta domain protein n=1 Tax=Dictyocaulus viviparus TaxID=29172 RepID=A0A0D8XTU5_DICVI|nr:alpha amylase, all-beta domain protein [Dictyocaulus viviparus]
MSRPPQLDNLLKLDSWLNDFQNEICRRYGVFLEYQKKIEECGGIEHFTQGYKNFGLLVQSDNSVLCHEWAPGADQLALIGDFNGWNRETHKYTKEGFGKWRLVIPPNSDGSCAIPHSSIVKIAVTKNGKTMDKLSPWAMYVTRPNDSVVYHQQFYNPPDKYTLKHPRPSRPASLRIYEAHVGISSWEGKVNTYRAFADDVIPRIHRQGYNTIQLMAVMEHVYYASFGYQVTSFFAPARIETLRFLLSNLRWWVEEYGFDGFRFDGVTSMIYHSHGMNDDFGGGYPMYFGLNADTDSLVYLMLANDFLHKKYPQIITIAEEVSGMPALCRSVAEGGQGFDFRLAMALPDMWIKILKHVKDEDWNVNEIVHTLENRRYGEANIAYAESHDQALVGDKTIAFWLMDKEMYDFMSILTPLTPIIERGIALHKMIRLLTMALGGEAWLNFIGNEFGHPEWLDFPRIGNNESFHYARRQFNLADDDNLRYKFLNLWDQEINRLEENTGFLHKGPAYVSWKHNGDKMICFERAGVLFVFNFHPFQSFPDYKVGVEIPGVYKLVLNSDEERFGGHNRLQFGSVHHSFPEGYAGRRNHILVYAPARTCLIFSL